MNMNTMLTEIKYIFTNKGYYTTPEFFCGLAGVSFFPYNPYYASDFLYTDGLNNLADFAAKYFKADEVISRIG